MKKFFCVSLVAALSLLFFSCSNFFSSSSSDNESAPNGKARVHFSVGKTDARTIMPEIYTEENISLVELTAQKISEGEATVYKLDGENEKLSWTSLADLENDSIDIDYGTYTFVLNLSIEDGEENKTVLVQTCTLENQEINADTKELVFNMQEDSGDVSIAVSWELRDEPNRIGKIKAGLYTIASNGENTIGISDAEKTLTIKGADTSVTAIGSYASVPSGSYLIKLFLYDSESSTTPFNTITDIIKVNGYKTLYDLKLDPNELNVQYEAVFDPNGGTWEDNTPGPKTVLHNAYSGFVPPDGVSKTGFELVGWYKFPDDRIPEAQGISGGTSYERIAREDYAQDYKFFAIWGKKTSGELIKDNRALIIKTDIVDGKIYQNSKINLSVTDSNGKTVTDAIKYDAKILYKGKDINGLTVDGCPYYQAEGKEIFLRGQGNPIPKGKYQLYVTASRSVAIGGDGEPVTSSQTFDVELVDGYATPETQVALYNKAWDSQNSTYKYSYYLKNYDAVGETLGTDDFTTSREVSVAFDAYDNFYCLNGKTLKSTNSVIPDDGIFLSLDGEDYYNKAFVIDLATNTAYAYIQYENLMSLYKYPKLLTDGDAETYKQISGVTSISYGDDSSDWMNFSRLVINNNILYALVNDFLVVCDISSGTASKIDELDLNGYMSTTMGLSGPAINDIFAMEGAAYLLVKDSFNGTKENTNIYRRGSIIEYIPPEIPEESGTKRFMTLNATPTIANTAISNMALYHDNGNYDGASPLYAEKGSRTPANDAAVVTVANPGAGFPNIYAVAEDENEDENYLSSPAKVIGLKPKKLVIADDGCAFYSDTECLKYKNMNRVATIDLEKFFVESVKTTKAEFASSVSDYLRSGINLSTLGTSETSQPTGYRFASSGSVWASVTVNDSSDYLYLSVKSGDTE